MYTISCAVNFQDGTQKTKQTTLSIFLITTPAATPEASIDTTGVSSNFNLTTGTWFVTGLDTIKRITPPTVYDPNFHMTSQFWNKVLTHEGVHIQQWQTGIFSDLYQPAALSAILAQLIGTSQDDILGKIDAAITAFNVDSHAKFIQRANTAEQQAYAVSNPIVPQYAYMSGCH